MTGKWKFLRVFFLQTTCKKLARLGVSSEWQSLLPRSTSPPGRRCPFLRQRRGTRRAATPPWSWPGQPWAAKPDLFPKRRQCAGFCLIFSLPSELEAGQPSREGGLLHFRRKSTDFFEPQNSPPNLGPPTPPREWVCGSEPPLPLGPYFPRKI